MKKTFAALCAALIATALLAFGGCSGGNTVLAEAYLWLLDNYSETTVESCFTITADGQVVTADTNPNDRDDYLYSGSVTVIQAFNEQIGVPDSVWDDMLTTSYLDGEQSATVNEIIHITWTYHPDRGLEVTYSYV